MTNNPLHPLFRKIKGIENDSNAEKGAESNLVTWTLKRLLCSEIINDHRGELLSFGLVNALPKFPMTFGYTRLPGRPPLHRDPNAIHPLWLKAFLNLPFVEIYNERYELADKTRPFGLVFPRKGFGNGLVIHNGDVELFVPPVSCCHLFRGGKRHAMTLVVQPYITLIDCIREDIAWTL